MWGHILSTMGGIMSTIWGIMSTVGVILSTVEDTEYHGRYHDAHGDIMSTVGVFSTVAKIFCFLSSPMVLNTPYGTHDIPTCIMISPTVLKLQRVVSPHGSHDIPHMHSTPDIPWIISV